MVYVHTMETPADAIDKGKCALTYMINSRAHHWQMQGFHLHIQEILKELSMR